MKFDSARAVELTQTFAFDRGPGTTGARRAANLAAWTFEQIGYTVERVEVSGSPTIGVVRPTLTMLGFGGFLLLSALGASVPHAERSRGSELAMVAAAFAWLWLGPVVLTWLTQRFGGSIPTESLMARRPSSADPPARVVFLTPLDSPMPGRPDRRHRLAGWTLGAIFAALLVVDLIGFRLPLVLIFAVEILFLAALYVRILASNLLPFPTGDLLKSDGLATLLELARTWPEPTNARIETWFVAVGGQTLDRAGLRDLNHRIREDWPRKPTLVIEIWSPGLGPPFDLAANGPGGWRPLKAAAEGLWIPHQTHVGRHFDGNLWPFRTGGVPDEVTLIGVGGKTIRPESMALAAQLATEVALRWAKRQAVHDEPAIAARSSQNPG